MNDSETVQFIETVLNPLWPRWKCGDEESRMWVKTLSHYDYNLARQAVNNLFISQEHRGIEPVISKIVNAVRKIQQIKNPTGGEPVLLYTIIKESLYQAGKNPRIYGKGFYVGNSNLVPAPEEIERMAERDRQHASQMYAANHIIIRNWEGPRANADW